LPLAAAALRFPELDLSDDRAAYEFEARVLEQAPPKALILSRRDTHTFTLWYFQYALGRRPDVVTVDLDLLGYEWYAHDLSEQLNVELPRARSAQGGQDLRRWIETVGRPLCRIEGEGTELVCTEPSSTARSGDGL
jgi:hypothetical protein